MEDAEPCRDFGRAGRSAVGGPEEGAEGRGKVVAILNKGGKVGGTAEARP